MNKLYNKEEWMDHVKRFRELKLSVNRYCKENYLKPSSFRYWLNKDNDKDVKLVNKKRFVKCEIKDNTKSDNKALLLKYSFYEITVPAGFSKSDLSRLIDVLDEKRLC